MSIRSNTRKSVDHIITIVARIIVMDGIAVIVADRIMTTVATVMAIGTVIAAIVIIDMVIVVITKDIDFHRQSSVSKTVLAQ
jgi:sensor domain CHASE-containing protein